MANEILNVLVASLRFDGLTETILGQQGIASVVRQQLGIYVVTLIDAIAPSEATFSGVAEETPGGDTGVIRVGGHLQGSENVFIVGGFEEADGPADVLFTVNVWRARTGVRTGV